MTAFLLIVGYLLGAFITLVIIRWCEIDQSDHIGCAMATIVWPITLFMITFGAIMIPTITKVSDWANFCVNLLNVVFPRKR